MFSRHRRVDELRSSASRSRHSYAAGKILFLPWQFVTKSSDACCRAEWLAGQPKFARQIWEFFDVVAQSGICFQPNPFAILVNAS